MSDVSPDDKYRVVWPRAVRDAFDRIYVGASEHDQARLLEAMVELDVYLRFDPLGLGEERGGEERIGFVRPLAVKYRLIRPARTVIVIGVHRFDRPG